MAKKNYVIAEQVWNSKIEALDNNQSRITISGKNKRGTQLVIKIKVDDYFFPYMIADMAKIGRQRLADATARNNAIIEAVKEK